MVNSINSGGPVVPDMGPKVQTGASGGASAKPITPSQSTDTAPALQTKQAAVNVPSAAPPLVESAAPAMAPPLTSLALWRDMESGMQVAVIRDRVSGEVVEKFPTDRAIRLAAMVKQQEAMAQELQQQELGTPRVDLKT